MRNNFFCQSHWRSWAFCFTSLFLFRPFTSCYMKMPAKWEQMGCEQAYETVRRRERKTMKKHREFWANCHHLVVHRIVFRWVDSLFTLLILSSRFFFSRYGCRALRTCWQTAKSAVFMLSVIQLATLQLINARNKLTKINTHIFATKYKFRTRSEKKRLTYDCVLCMLDCSASIRL